MNYLDYMIPKYQNAGKILVPWATNGEKEGDTREGSYGKETLIDGRWVPTRDQKWYEKLSESDWYTLGSIIGDLAGLGLGAAGLSPAAAVAGAASTTSQLIGDIKRDGFQWG